MKKYIILLFVAFAVSQAFGQKKYKPGSKDYQIDSLSKSTAMYSARTDSLTKVTDSLTVISKNYHILYTTIREKVLRVDFDPARTSQIIDSLAAGRDSTYMLLSNSSAALMDTLTFLKKQNKLLRTTLDSYAEEENYKNRLLHELKQLKDLEESKILTDEEFTTMKKKLLQKWQ